MFVLSIPWIFETRLKYNGIYFDGSNIEFKETIIVRSQQDFLELPDKLASYDKPALVAIVLVTDIDLQGQPFQLLSSPKEVYGVIKGNWHTISNMNATGHNGGLFGYAKYWIISELKFVNPIVRADYDGGIIAGHMDSCIVNDIYIDNPTLDVQQSCGSVAGVAVDSRIRNVHVIISAEPKGGIGGLVVGSAKQNTVVEDVHVKVLPTVDWGAFGSSTSTYDDMPVARRFVKEYI
jgi:hypothetical protein